jgi:hypothetical protein
MTFAPKYATAMISSKEKLASTTVFAIDGSGFTKSTVKMSTNDIPDMA